MKIRIHHIDTTWTTFKDVTGINIYFRFNPKQPESATKISLILNNKVKHKLDTKGIRRMLVIE